MVTKAALRTAVFVLLACFFTVFFTGALELSNVGATVFNSVAGTVSACGVIIIIASRKVGTLASAASAKIEALPGVFSCLGAYFGG